MNGMLIVAFELTNDGNDKQQAAVFELGKDVVRVTLATLEARTGRKIEYEDDEARKHLFGQR